MKLYYDKRSSDPIYYMQVGIRNGKKVTTKNIERIGKHSELLKEHPDPLAYAKKYIEDYNKKIKEEKLDICFTLDFNEKLLHSNNIYSKSTATNIGYFFLHKLCSDLMLNDFFNEITKDRKIKFDMNAIIRTLVYGRILDPRSKLGTFNRLDAFYNIPSFSYHHIGRAMDILAEHSDKYIEHLFKYSDKIIKRNTSVCYFDCTNFYFEKEMESEDEYDEVTGELIVGLLKYGVSKEHRPNPIVQMGLFMDGDGIPLSMGINPGNQNEALCVIPLEEKLLKMFKDKDVIYCSDAGLGYSNARLFNNMGGRKFIVTQSIKKLSTKSKEAVFNDFDYKLLSNDKNVTVDELKTFDKTDEDNIGLYNDFAYKIFEVNDPVDIGLYEEKTTKSGKKKKVKSYANLKQYIIVTYSRKMAEYQKTVRNRQVERAKAIIENSDPEKKKKGPNDVMRFIKKQSKTKDDYILDEDKIKEEEKYDGYYAIATNINDMTVQEILDINSERYKIEDCFRIMKTNFDSRPVYQWKRERIHAHFLICYTSLLVYRLLEVKLKKIDKSFSTENIIETLKNMNVINCNDMYYQAAFTSSKVNTALNELFNFGLDKKYYQANKLNKLSKF